MSAHSPTRMHSLVEDAVAEDSFSRFRNDSVREAAQRCLSTMRSLPPPYWTNKADILVDTQKIRSIRRLPS